MGEEKPDEELMGKRKSSPRLSTTSIDVDTIMMNAFAKFYTSRNIFLWKYFRIWYDELKIGFIRQTDFLRLPIHCAKWKRGENDCLPASFGFPFLTSQFFVGSRNGKQDVWV